MRHLVPKLGVCAQFRHRRRQTGKIPRFEKEAITPVFCQMGEIAKIPSHHRKAGGHRFAVDGPLSLAHARQNEHIRGPVHRPYFIGRDGTVSDYPLGKVAARQQFPNPCCISRIDSLATH